MKYRKKPVIIDAVQFPADGIKTEELSAFLGWPHDRDAYNWLEIETLEGIHRAMPGDFILKGVKGEFYPCKPDIFALTYEEVQE